MRKRTVTDSRKKREIMVVILAVAAGVVIQEYMKPTLKKALKVR